MTSSRTAFCPLLTLTAAAFTAALSLSTACVSRTTYEAVAVERLQQGAHGRAVEATRRAVDTDATQNAPSDGSLDWYVLQAMNQHPELEAAFDDWKASVYAIAERRELPDPVLSYGVFLRRLETRVGPQRQRFGLRQTIPWPSKRRMATRAAATVAEAAERRFDALISTIRRRVARAYWRVWQVRRVRDIQTEQRALMVELAAAARTRIAVGKGSLADLSQIDLAISRHDDALAHLDAEERVAKAGLRAAFGGTPDNSLAITAEPPEIGVPIESIPVLRDAASQHPRIEQHAVMARASTDQAEAAGTRGLPDFTLGLEYLETGAAHTPGIEDSGKDPIMMTVSLSLPVWRNQYRASVHRSLTEASAHRARARQAHNLSIADIDTSLTRMEHSTDRVALYRSTLLPQAQTVLEATIGDYQTGKSGLTQVLAAQQTLLELRLALMNILVVHAQARATLEDVVGRPVSVRTGDDNHD